MEILYVQLGANVMKPEIRYNYMVYVFIFKLLSIM